MGSQTTLTAADLAAMRGDGFRAAAVDEWAGLVRKDIDRLRSAVDDAACRASSIERQLRVIVQAEEDISAVAERANATIGREWATTDSAATRLDCTDAVELAHEARTVALAVMVECRLEIAGLYDVGAELSAVRIVGTDGDAVGADITTPAEAGPSADRAAPESHLAYLAADAERYMNELTAVTARLAERHAEEKDRATLASARLRQVADATPRHMRSVAFDTNGERAWGARQDHPDGEQSTEAEVAVSEARRGARQITEIVRSAVDSVYLQAEDDLLGAPATDRLGAAEQSA